MSVLEVQNLCVHFPVHQPWVGRPRHFVRAVDGVSFSIRPGETVGLVGESGSGKTTLGRAVVRLVEPTSGRIVFEGEDISALSGRELRARRRKFQMIFQDPYGSLDPRFTVSEVIGEALDIHGLTRTQEERRHRIEGLLSDVGLDPSHASRYPHEFSGGQRQRIGVARALAVKPKLIVCDEPVSALDVSVQAQVVNLLKDVQREHGIAYLFIAHDLAVVEHVSQRIVVLYLGRVVELGNASSLCRAPKHPYTQALLSAVPVLDPDGRRKRILLTGEIPSPIHPPAGCPFHPRCPVAEPRCRQEVPALREVEPGHWTACHLAK
ncbi:MAG TPA: ABC transporter ATP-binding protein [Verrucomicrobiae bacterium]|nr:ABC transporter ATP-binding protein [Verrucomicrobiae bacterium]